MKKERVMDVVDLIEEGGREVIDWNENYIREPQVYQYPTTNPTGDNVSRIAREIEKRHRRLNI